MPRNALRFIQTVCLSALGLALILTLLSADPIIAAQRELVQTEATYVSSAESLRALPDGSGVTLEGRISRQMPAVHGSLVTYIHKEGSTLYGTYWHTLEQITPPLTLDVSESAIRVTNADYGLVNTNTEPGGYFGFRADSPIVVVGNVVHDAQGQAIVAAIIRGGTYLEYIFELRWSASFLLILDAGLALLTMLVYELGRVGRRPVGRIANLA